jgi:hypothetical protein
MTTLLAAALIFTLALFVVTTYFILGSLPLLILKHDTPLDSKFIRGFFNIYYLSAIGAASATAVCYGLAARAASAAAARLAAAASSPRRPDSDCTRASRALSRRCTAAVRRSMGGVDMGWKIFPAIGVNGESRAA